MIVYSLVRSKINKIKLVCVQLPTSADNVTLLELAAKRHAAVRLAAARPAAAAVDRYLLSAGPTAANPPQRHAVVDRRDRETDRRTDTVPSHRYCLILCEQCQ